MTADNSENGSGAVQANISPNEASVLKFLLDNKGAWIREDQIHIDGIGLRELASSVSWLESKGLIDVNRTEISTFQLTEEGRRFLTEGLPEERAYYLILSRKHVAVPDLMKELGETDGKIALAQLAKLGIKPRNGVLSADGAPLLDDEFRKRKSFLNSLAAGSGDMPADMINHFRKRENVIQERKRISRSLRINESGVKAVSASVSTGNLLGEITPDIIASARWKTSGFQPYDLNSRVEKILGSGVHPITYLSRMVKEIFLELGFSEMPGHYIEYAAWNMDALFIPQDHPARDMQDTFYLDTEGKPEMEHPEIMDVLSRVHEKGIRGYNGWGYRWSRDKASQLLLRTHTTVSTIRYLYEHPEPPQAVFSVEKVFRHESVDWKHLAELNQIEGAYYGKDASLASLKWLMREFYSRLGFTDLKFIPSYYPYTEPSMDVVGTINGKEMELGGSGVFRPEVTKPLGLKVPVIAWGLGLERLAMIYFGLSDIREIYQSDLDWLRTYRLRV